jgi:PD-(D/E)XK nuclease superfamily
LASNKIKRPIYKGLLIVSHNPDAKGSQPRYEVFTPKGEQVGRPTGVTTILGQVLAKDLVGWALSEFEKALLEHEGEPITAELLIDNKWASNKKRDKGADVGSQVHALIEGFHNSLIHKESVPMAMPEEPQVMKAYDGFLHWFAKEAPEPLATEEPVYSERYRYAGCLDAIYRWKGKTWLVDVKTTNASKSAPKGVYPEMFWQTAAYAMAYEEQGGKYKIDGLMILSVKKNGRVDVVTNEDLGLALEEAKGGWLSIYRVWALTNRLKKGLGR